MSYNPIQTNSISLKFKILNILWGCVNVTIFRFTPPYLTFFRVFRVFLVKLFGGDLDWTVSLKPSAKIEYPWNLHMRGKSSLGEKVWCYALSHIYIGENTCIGKDVYLLTGSHDTKSKTFDLITKPINIGSGCWIATGATILPGVCVGDFSIVSAQSVVHKNILPYSIVGGNPAVYIKKREFNHA